MATLKLKIEGMHCDGCSKTIQGYLLTHDGVKSAAVSFETKIGGVEFDEVKVKEEDIINMIKEVGYSATKL